MLAVDNNKFIERGDIERPKAFRRSVGRSTARRSGRIAGKNLVFSASARVEVAELKTVKADRVARELSYLVMLDSMPDGVCCFDERDRLIFCNRRYAEMYCLSPEQLRPGVTLREIAEARFAAGAKSVYSGRVDEPV